MKLVFAALVFDSKQTGPPMHGSRPWPWQSAMYGLQLSTGELEELVWLIEEMGIVEADAECAKSRARLVRENQLDTLGSC